MLRMLVVAQEKIRAYGKDESGATAIEYGLIATLIAVAIIVGATAVGSQLNTVFQNIKTELE